LSGDPLLHFLGGQSIPRHGAADSLFLVGGEHEDSIYLLLPPVSNLQQQRGDEAYDSGFALGREPGQLPVDGGHDRRMGEGVQSGDSPRVAEHGCGELSPVEAPVLAEEFGAEFGSDPEGQRGAGAREVVRDLVRVDDDGALAAKELGC